MKDKKVAVGRPFVVYGGGFDTVNDLFWFSLIAQIYSLFF